MSAGWTILVIAASWIGLIGLIRLVIVPWLAHGPQGDPVTGIMWRVIRIYCRLVHHATFQGLESVRQQMGAGPLIVVSNHTGAIDPLLIQAGCRFHIRWMMASEMMTPLLDFVWLRQKPIPVDRDGRDSGPAREAIRHVQAGGIIGIFPEGRIVFPPRQVRPFYTGVGLIVARAKAPVMLVWVCGTPDTTDMRASIFQSSHARVRYIEIIDFKGERDAHKITARLRERLSKISGWPLNDDSIPPNFDQD